MLKGGRGGGGDKSREIVGVPTPLLATNPGRYLAPSRLARAFGTACQIAPSLNLLPCLVGTPLRLPCTRRQTFPEQSTL